jgi:ABC-type nitrate/sulfonate/bicarbonate transport system substrate-binding protein
MRTVSAVVLLLLSVSVAPGAARSQTVRAGYTSRDLNYLPFFIAQKRGFYAKEGLQVDLVSIGRSDVQLQALVTGDLHFANINADGIII